ncbi:MAG: extracellular solute-binding protein, partial [Chloroflexota bacterium]
MLRNDTRGTVKGSNRRSFLRIGGFVAGLTAWGACAPSAAPVPGPGPAVPQSPAAQTPAWQREWDLLVEAAKKEGKLVVATLAGDGRRKAIVAFQDAFPGITVEHQSFSSASLFVPKLLQERAGGLYNWDVYVGGAPTMLQEPKKQGALEPLRPLLFRPDVLDDKAWRNGFEFGFVDEAKQLAYLTMEYAQLVLAVNTSLVPEGAIKSVKDLLDPAYRGKIAMADTRSGFIFPAMIAVKDNLGEDAVRQLVVGQQPVFIRDARQLVESVVRGQYPIAFGMDRLVLIDFQNQGIGKNVKATDLPEARAVTGAGVLFYINRAPHPNAAKLFANWFMTKDVQ